MLLPVAVVNVGYEEAEFKDVPQVVEFEVLPVAANNSDAALPRRLPAFSTKAFAKGITAST